MALAVVPGMALGFICALLSNPDWAFDGLAPIVCVLLSILGGMVLGAVAGWRSVREREQEVGSLRVFAASDDYTWPPPIE